jgi:hypothetical protein
MVYIATDLKIGRAKSKTTCVLLYSNYLYDCMRHKGDGSLKKLQQTLRRMYLYIHSVPKIPLPRLCSYFGETLFYLQLIPKGQ